MACLSDSLCTSVLFWTRTSCRIRTRSSPDSKGIPASLADAKAKGIPVIAYGQFINDIIGFLIVALAVFLIVKQVNRIKSAVDKPAATATVTKECQFCASTISIKALSFSSISAQRSAERSSLAPSF